MDVSKKDQLALELKDKLAAHLGVTPQEATVSDLLSVSAILIRERIARTRAAHEGTGDRREVHYLSMEFLMGRSLAKNAFNLGILDELWGAIADLGFEPADVFESEPDAGLGNGGLGRLAACYMDSAATLDLPVTGYSLCYELGMFRQVIENGKQLERPDKWGISRNNWLVTDYDDAVDVRLGGTVEECWDYQGRCETTIKNCTVIRAVPCDMFIAGYGNDRVNRLRLWDVRSPHSLDMGLFFSGEYLKALEERTRAEVITKVLYPADDSNEGKILRIQQQYFLVSATAQSVVQKHVKKYGTVKNFAEHHVFQINDTHPTMVIPELMRIFMDEHEMGWDEAMDIVKHCVAYTNHTVLAEALECWPQELISQQLPRVWQIICELDARHRRFLEEHFPNDSAAVQRNLILEGGRVHMANICLAVCCKINGVSALHSDILKNDLFRDMNSLDSARFTNVTNGIDHRRWLAQINPELHSLIVRLLGNDAYLTDASLLKKLELFDEDDSVLRELEEIKRRNKLRFSDYLQAQGAVRLNADAIFDVQVKRLHEYKRQLLCAMLITHLQQRIHDEPNAEFLPRSFIFGAKAASSYFVAKRIISLICSLADDVNSDPLCQGKLQVVFAENYRVSVAEKLMPAAQVSEQISTAGKEASGTGNMKLMMNGAVTIGTLDGANVEMHELLGDENMFIFGLHAQEVTDLKQQGYSPADYYERDRRINYVLNRFSRGFRDGESYSDLVSRLVYGGDDYMLLADFDGYVSAHDRMYSLLADSRKRAQLSLRNIARSGVFAADRAVSQYAENIWKLK